MTHPTDFRALCAELTDELEEWIDGYLINDPSDIHTDAAYKLIERVRAALAEQQQGALSDDPPDKDAPSWYNSDMAHAWEAGRASGWTDAITRYSAQAVPVAVAIPVEQWHEDDGFCLWWKFPINEPPYSGSPLDSDWPGYHTHFTRLVCPVLPKAQQ